MELFVQAVVRPQGSVHSSAKMPAAGTPRAQSGCPPPSPAPQQLSLGPRASRRHIANILRPKWTPQTPTSRQDPRRNPPRPQTSRWPTTHCTTPLQKIPTLKRAPLLQLRTFQDAIMTQRNPPRTRLSPRVPRAGCAPSCRFQAANLPNFLFSSQFWHQSIQNLCCAGYPSAPWRICGAQRENFRRRPRPAAVVCAFAGCA